jgi:hypothetical protein
MDVVHRVQDIRSCCRVVAVFISREREHLLLCQRMRLINAVCGRSHARSSWKIEGAAEITLRRGDGIKNLRIRAGAALRQQTTIVNSVPSPC